MSTRLSLERFASAIEARIAEDGGASLDEDAVYKLYHGTGFTECKEDAQTPSAQRALAAGAATKKDNAGTKGKCVIDSLDFIWPSSTACVA